MQKFDRVYYNILSNCHIISQYIYEKAGFAPEPCFKNYPFIFSYIFLPRR